MGTLLGVVPNCPLNDDVLFISVYFLLEQNQKLSLVS